MYFIHSLKAPGNTEIFTANFPYAYEFVLCIIVFSFRFRLACHNQIFCVIIFGRNRFWCTKMLFLEWYHNDVM